MLSPESTFAFEARRNATKAPPGWPSYCRHVAARLGTGISIASLALIAAVPAFQAGTNCLAYAFLGLFAGLLLLAAAPVLPGLHALPLVGAPRLTATFTVNGSAELAAGIGPDEEEGRTLLVRVGVRNHSRADVAHALLNFCFPVGSGLRACDAWGEPDDRGRRMPPTQELRSFDYWAIDDLRLRDGRNSISFTSGSGWRLASIRSRYASNRAASTGSSMSTRRSGWSR